MIERITQSFIKAMRDFVTGQECGNIIRYQFVEGKLLQRKSKDMAEGSYFEFLLTGAMPKDQQVPQPVYMKSALKKLVKDRKIDDMTVDYRRAHINAERVKKLLTVEMGLEFVKIGRKITKGKFEGTIDIVCKATKDLDLGDGLIIKAGEFIVIDLKYSGLLYNKWEKFGWEWSDIQKEYHGVQAVQYNFITGIPFFFLVVSNTNKEEEQENGEVEFAPTELKLFHVPVDEHMTQKHLNEANGLFERFKFEAEVGLLPAPSYIRCAKCPIKDSCKDKHIYPRAEVVDLTIGINE